MRMVLAGVCTFALLLAGALPAWAGEEVEGQGWSLRLPDGFSEAMSVEGGGSFKVSSRFGNLPIDGIPEIKAYTVGGGAQPHGMLMVARVNVSREITTTDQLGLDKMDEFRGQLPTGCTIEATTVGAYQAIELRMTQDAWDGEMVSRVLTIACGDYIVVVMLMTDEGTFPNSGVMWADLKTSIDIDPPMNRVLLFGLLGIGALGAFVVLGRLGTRPTRETEDHTGRFRRFQDNPDGSGSTSASPFGPGAAPMKTGVRPQKLPSSRPVEGAGQPSVTGRPPVRAPAASGSQGPPAPPPGPARPAAPATRRATSSAVTRPPVPPMGARPGLRPTLPSSGQWGK